MTGGKRAFSLITNSSNDSIIVPGCNLVTLNNLPSVIIPISLKKGLNRLGLGTLT